MSQITPEAAAATADQAAVFAALGDPTRLALVDRLADGTSHSLTRLTEGRALTRQAVSKHLKVLEGAGLVTCERVGRESLYALRGERLADVRAYLAEVTRQWDDALGRLKRFVEGGPGAP